ncbi:MAG: hypothetical protein AB1353_07390 [Aquificota bacterium]|jgi:hypothetical protein|nr:hypothetical protein [Aquificaceae bacterium]MDM7267529.1 hypothetical protein [Aquificaceae bacterium]QWK13346.1 MAG: hypothetical protein KNN14_01675 [Aquificota bacterium]HAV39966.1 hypothetical protein [Aquificaceae bacterium]HCO39059.1 hypothetical protein [Aquificaceae bacterium]
MGKKEKLEQESLEEQVEELRKDVFKVFELLLPPKEIRREVMKNLYTIELSFWKILKTLVDYEVSKLEGKIEKREKKEKVKRIEVE